ncbi:S66 peptidase family protein [Streptomyces sp. GMR22]|uniref:S66 peptidase family protein n=1 Tax=Streptomyces sp. GMR22 TaxID=2759524 RepID=UPI0015FC2118|nr:LD-carboxypeptidase [Streptomyces sp. GMR22]MBA6434280.1 LD-carboxypeptidase [Streptomyces sp. GMR22]
MATRGGKGAYRIVDDLDIDALRRDPKPLVGFSDITHLHLALWARCGLASLHGPFANWSDEWSGPASAEALRRALMATDPVIIHRDTSAASAAVTVEGTATGVLVGGNLDAIRTEAGAGLPSLEGTILFLEHQRGTGLGEVDRALTQLTRTGALEGLCGVALGQFLGFDQDADDPTLGGWGIADVLRDRLTRLGVPVLGGLPAGHGLHPPTIPLGTQATIDTAERNLDGSASRRLTVDRLTQRRQERRCRAAAAAVGPARSPLEWGPSPGTEPPILLLDDTRVSVLGDTWWGSGCGFVVRGRRLRCGGQ